MSEWAITLVCSGLLVGFAVADDLMEHYLHHRRGSLYLHGMLFFVGGMTMMYALFDIRSTMWVGLICWLLGLAAGIVLAAAIEAWRLYAIGQLPEWLRRER